MKKGNIPDLAPLEVLLGGARGTRNLIWMMAGLVAGWFVYVPVHELLHAAGCLLGGGAVTTLQIQSLYGGGLLEKVFPFVEAGGEYAGRLSNFDTGGSDWVYALTVALPLILVLPAFAGMYWAAVATRPLLFGALLVPSLSPLLSVTGDMLELATLLLYQVWPGEGTGAWITDDLFRILSSPPGPWTPGAAGFIALGQILALVMACCLVWLGDRLGRKIVKLPPD